MIQMNSLALLKPFIINTKDAEITMELPGLLIEDAVEERSIFYFTKRSEIGIPGHMHICVKIKDRVLFFSTCTSQSIVR